MAFGTKRKYDYIIEDTDIRYVRQLIPYEQDSLRNKIFKGLEETIKSDSSNSSNSSESKKSEESLITICKNAYDDNKNKKWGDFQNDMITQVTTILENDLENNPNSNLDKKCYNIIKQLEYNLEYNTFNKILQCIDQINKICYDNEFDNKNLTLYRYRVELSLDKDCKENNSILNKINNIKILQSRVGKNTSSGGYDNNYTNYVNINSNASTGSPLSRESYAPSLF